MTMDYQQNLFTASAYINLLDSYLGLTFCVLKSTTIPANRLIDQSIC